MLDKWIKEGDFKVLAEYHGKCLILQTFRNLKTGERKDYSLFYGRNESAMVLALTRDRQVILIREFRFGSNRIKIQLPGGNSEKGEDILTTAARELFEETGWKAGRLIQLSNPLFIDPASSESVIYPFLALDCELQNLDQIENVEIELIPFSHWLEMIKSGQIDEFYAIAITYLAESYI